MDSKEKAMKIKMLQSILEKEYGIKSPTELMAAMRDIPKMDISIFVAAPTGKECFLWPEPTKMQEQNQMQRI